MENASANNPYIELNRNQWSDLRMSTPSNITEENLTQLRGLGENLDLLEIADIYLPLARLIHLQVAAKQSLYNATSTFLGKYTSTKQVPFIVGIAGSVAVGKSTTSRILQTLLSQWKEHQKVDLVTTDGFLYSNQELTRRNIMHRKGFPESFNTKSLMKFVTDVKSGVGHITAPIYSHISYDIVPNQYIEINHPDILILEGLNVLQTAPRLMVSDLFDFSIYVDAKIEDIESWYLSRFLQLRTTAFNQPNSFFKSYANLSDTETLNFAKQVWNTTNKPNLIENILPTRPRATLVLRKNKDHSIYRIRFRKV